MRPHSNLDLLGACLWASIALTVVAISNDMMFRTVLCAPLVFLLSGHAMVRALGFRTTSLSEHLACSIGASLAAAIAGGFVLNAFHSLTPLGWAVWFCVIIVGASLAAVARRNAADLPALQRPAGLRLWHGAAFALAVLVATGAYSLAIRDEANERQFKYTEFWMLPSAAGDPSRLTIGVRSAESQPQRFDVEITLDGRPLAMFRSLNISPGDTWVREIAVPVSVDRQKAEARLYRLEGNRLYRSVSTLLPPN